MLASLVMKSSPLSNSRPFALNYFQTKVSLGFLYRIENKVWKGVINLGSLSNGSSANFSGFILETVSLIPELKDSKTFPFPAI